MTAPLITIGFFLLQPARSHSPETSAMALTASAHELTFPPRKTILSTLIQVHDRVNQDCR